MARLAALLLALPCVSCSPQLKALSSGRGASHDLAQAARSVEAGCGLAQGALLRPDGPRRIWVKPAAAHRLSFRDYECVFEKIGPWTARGIQVRLIGEDA